MCGTNMFLVNGNNMTAQNLTLCFRKRHLYHGMAHKLHLMGLFVIVVVLIVCLNKQSDSQLVNLKVIQFHFLLAVPEGSKEVCDL